MLVCTGAYAQQAVYASNQPNALYPETFDSEKVSPPGLKMKRIGTAMTIVGGAFIVTGVVMMATADEIRFSNYQVDDDGNVEESGDNQGYYGVLFTANGLALTGTGIVLWKIGARKYRNATQTQSNLSIGPTRNGVGLRLRF